MPDREQNHDTPIRSLWSESEAGSLIGKYAAAGIDEALAAQVYATRLIGGNPHLVLHGGGNSSVKATATDLFGDEKDVLFIKGSGHDMATIAPEGMPAVELAPLRRLETLQSIGDEKLVAIFSRCLLDTSSPRPSVETLLHAFLPHKYILHTHASAILAVTDQPDGESICTEIYGARMGNVPYTFSGLALARKCAKVHAENPGIEGLVLHKHGLVTFAETAKQAYERMIEMVAMAQERIATTRRTPAGFAAVKLPERIAPASDVLPVIRGICTGQDQEGRHEHVICDLRTGDRILEYVNGKELESYAMRGVVTPDNIIRIKNHPLILPAPDGTDMPGFAAAAQQRCRGFADAYDSYFARNNARQEVPRTKLDSMPRLVLVPGLGLIGLGRTAREAGIAADLGAEAVSIISDAEAIGTFESIPEEILFGMEYWPLEQAKLTHRGYPPLAGQTVIVTGGAGAIGAACARLFSENGAEVAVLDLDEKAATGVASRISSHALGIGCDVTRPAAVRAAFDQVCRTFGGVDIVISNAGGAWQGRIGELDDAVLRKSFELNFFSHQCVAQNAVRVMLAQKTGGVLLFNSSKQAINPGANFGAYGLPKAATLFLSRQYALEYGADGIRSNAVNADRIRSGLLSDEMIASRSRARGISEKEYLSGNLLGQEVTAYDVAQAFLHQALARKTTADVTTVDGGNIAAILR